jgi:hypothetical protein
MELATARLSPKGKVAKEKKGGFRVGQERHCKRGDMPGIVCVSIPVIPQKCGSSRRLSAPYLLSGRKDSFDLNLPALGAPFACGVVK